MTEPHGSASFAQNIRGLLGPTGASAAALRDVDANLKLLKAPGERPFDQLAKKLAEPQFAAEAARRLAETEARDRAEQVEREEAMVAALQSLRNAAGAQDKRDTFIARLTVALVVIAVLTLIAAIAAVVVAIVALK